MAVGRAERRAERRTKVVVLFADRTDRALDLLEILEVARHDVYGDVTPPEEVIDDILLSSEGESPAPDPVDEARPRRLARFARGRRWSARPHLTRSVVAPSMGSLGIK